MIRILFILLLLIGSGCAPLRKSVPPGTVPQQDALNMTDEQYGQEVLNQLLERYKLDNNDARINRVRDIIDQLTAAANAGSNPWHVWVLVDDSFANAAATRGNFIFVWTGMLIATQDDVELATVLAHELAHLLAGHTAPDPSEEVNEMITGLAGLAIGQVIASQGAIRPVVDLADILVREIVSGLIVNPDQQRKELEADHIGLFLMAQAGIDPEKAIQFWERAVSDPRFASHPIPFLSSHPTTAARLENLRQYLPAAIERYRASSFMSTNPSSAHAVDSSNSADKVPTTAWSVPEVTMVRKANHENAPVYSAPDVESSVVRTLPLGTSVTVKRIKGSWLEISDPVVGFMRRKDAADMK